MKWLLLVSLIVLGACAQGEPYYTVENDRVVTHHYKLPVADCPHKNTQSFEAVGCGTRCVRLIGVRCDDCGSIVSETEVK
jgi:hypothetical protein